MYLKEAIISTLYEILNPWGFSIGCYPSFTVVYVAATNVKFVKSHLNKNGYDWVEVKPYIS